LVFGFTHAVWLRLAEDDVSELSLECGTDKEFLNVVVRQPKPHTVGKSKNQEI
jgi:hypothetical protein